MEHRSTTTMQMAHAAAPTLHTFAGTASVLVRSIAAGVVYSVATALSRGGFAWEDGAVYVLTGTLTCLALSPFILHSRWSRQRSLLALWAALLFVRVMGLAIEGVLYRPATAANAVAVAATGVLVALVFAACAVWLLAPPARDARTAGLHAQILSRGWWGWTWRALAVGLAYLVFYFVFGSANALLYTRSFYENTPAYGLALPPVGAIFLALLIRAPLFGIAALVLARTAAAPRRALAIWLGMALFMAGGAAAFVETVFRTMPLGFDIATLIELFLQNFLTGVVAAYLFAPDTR